MSRRSAHLVDDSQRWHAFVVQSVHFPGPAHTHRSGEPGPGSQHAPVALDIFESLKCARFDSVRRAVRADPSCLRATHVLSSSLAAGSPVERRKRPVNVTPVDYALDLCTTWLALQDHCQRTGVSILYGGNLTFRERLKSMSGILQFLLSHPGTPRPTQSPLHIAIRCDFGNVVQLLLQQSPELACSRDTGWKTPLHTCCASVVRISAASVVRYVGALIREGADINARDNDNRTPLYDLVACLTASAPSYGLARTRARIPSLLTAEPVIDALVAAGADLCAGDKREVSPIELAFATGLDYQVLVRSGDRVYRSVCNGHNWSTRDGNRRVASGLFGRLPHDVILNIFSKLSPQDAVLGVGSTCGALRGLATSEHIWGHLQLDYTMDFVRRAISARERDRDEHSAG